MKIFKCDICGRKYTRKDQDFDMHDIGEYNICCESCAWELSHLTGESKPEHTCKEVK